MAMRIVGGRLRGRALATPKSDAIRPTTDRTRESLFNILSHAWPDALDGARVLDAFSGTGALGLEAMSRGAEFAMFMEKGSEGRGVLRTNVEALGLTGVTKISKSDATRPGAAKTIVPFTLVFADPPYGKGLGELALVALLQGGWIAQNALIVLEERRDSLPAAIPGFAFEQSRTFGDTAIGFFTVEPFAGR